MSDFVMLAAALAAVTVTFAVPLGFMISAALRAGWRIGLMSAATLALVWFALRFLLFGPVFLGGADGQDPKLGLLALALRSAAAGVVCGLLRLPVVLLSKKKPIPYESAVAVARICSSGLVILFGGIYCLWMLALRVGAVFSVGDSAQRLAELPERARLFWAMSGGGELSMLIFCVSLPVCAVIFACGTVLMIYGLRSHKYWYPPAAALVWVLTAVPVRLLSAFGEVVPMVYLVMIMLAALRVSSVCREHYYMYDMMARIDEKNRTGRPPRMF